MMEEVFIGLGEKAEEVKEEGEIGGREVGEIHGDILTGKLDW